MRYLLCEMYLNGHAPHFSNTHVSHELGKKHEEKNKDIKREEYGFKSTHTHKGSYKRELRRRDAAAAGP